MSKLPNLKPREVAEILHKAGFNERKTKSSHYVYKHPQTLRYTSVSFHPGTVPTGTLRAIIRQSGMTVDLFLGFRK